MKKIFPLSLVVCLALLGTQVSLAQHISITGIDPSIKPGDNFFMYVNKTWYDSVEIPSTQTGVGAYSFMNFPQRVRMQGILDSISTAKNPVGSIEQKVGDFYASGLDIATINKRGYEPIKPLLKSIDGITDIASLMKFVTEQQKFNNASIIGFRVGPDMKNSSINIVNLGQTGIGLPERDYYFKTDSSTIGIQKAYVAYVITLLKLSGTEASAAAKMASAAYAIEKELAASHKTNIERRNVQANYNKMALSAIATKQPNIGWIAYFNGLGVKIDSLNMQQPAYYERLNALLASVSIADWKAYLKAKSLITYADFLSKNFTSAAFEYSKILTGQSIQKPRGEEITDAVDKSLGHGLAQLYVKKYFPEEAKKRMRVLVDNLKKAFENRINNLEWMSDSTKAKAKEKLYAFSEKIGYPDKWRDYSKVTINRSTYFENRLATNQNDFNYAISKVGKVVDRTEWGTTPPTVTAYNNPPLNEIVFPAGILQPPYFDLNADDALNYGGIGMVIGHEITHSFDDQGAQYDKVGNVKNWWKEDDFKKFKAKTQQVIDQYNQFTVLDSLHVKGALTVGENTADIAGIAIAFDAFKLTQQGQSGVKIDGFTPEQRFFISIARIWRVKTKDAFMRMYVNTNPHSPAQWRVNGPLMNFTPFYKAFNVQPGDKMYKPEKDRITVW
ncbi:M13 family metallopeptidase [Emticicia sp. SJ17W-69]|uniref:M13 family metallopeptidase n=1 Tax=Emticicia sp. SJ17W-69 TaxID=3421657 RepID=UPI003EC06189